MEVCKHQPAILLFIFVLPVMQLCKLGLNSLHIYKPFQNSAKQWNTDTLMPEWLVYRQTIYFIFIIYYHYYSRYLHELEQIQWKMMWIVNYVNILLLFCCFLKFSIQIFKTTTQKNLNSGECNLNLLNFTSYNLINIGQILIINFLFLPKFD